MFGLLSIGQMIKINKKYMHTQTEKCNWLVKIHDCNNEQK